MTLKFFVLIIVAIIAIPFLTAIILFAIPFATLYFIFELLKKQPAIPEEKPMSNFFDFAIKNFKKNGVQN